MVTKYHQVYKFYRKFLMCFGIWVQENIPIPLWYKIFTIFVHILVGSHNIFLILGWIEYSESLKSFASIGYMQLPSITGQTKMLILLYNRSKLLSYIEQFDNPRFATRSVKEEHLLNKELSYFKKSSIVLMAVVVLSIVFFIILTYFWDINGNGLPYSAWYPYNSSQPGLLQVTYIHQWSVAAFCALGYVHIDILLSGSLIFIGLQCLILCERIQKIGEVEENIQNVLVDCIKHYRAIQKLLKENEKLFGIMYFWQMASSTITLCFNLFVISLSNPRSFEFACLAMCHVAFGGVLLVPCWFATEMTRKSELISFTIYFSKWVDVKNTFKKNIGLFILMTQKPLTFYAIGFFQISVTTFVSIYRIAMSYYAILNTLTGGDENDI